MLRKKTSRKQGFSFHDVETTQVKKNGSIKPFRASETLKNRGLVARALWQCLTENDVEGFKEILKAHLETLNKEEIIKETGLSRRTLFRMLSPEGNPTLKNISAIINKLCA